MEQFKNITEHARQARPVASPQISRPAAVRAPLYASPWVALFILLRREYRQLRTLES